jgi:hypothetical protein
MISCFQMIATPNLFRFKILIVPRCLTYSFLDSSCETIVSQSCCSSNPPSLSRRFNSLSGAARRLSKTFLFPLV